MEIFEVKFTVVKNEDEWMLKGCQGIHPSSTWRCDNCPQSQISKCVKSLKGHPDFTGIDIV